MNQRSRLLSVPRVGLALVVVLAGALYFMTQKLGMFPNWGGDPGGGANRAANDSARGDSGSPAPQPAPSTAMPISEPKPLDIVIDEHAYFVNNKPVEGVEELVKMSLAVPKDVSPRVRIVRRPTARYTATKNLSDALDAAKIDYIWAN
jgi:hypothetical protein